MPGVRSLVIRLSAEGAAQVKAQLAQISATLKDLSDGAKIPLSADDKGALIKLRALTLELGALKDNAAGAGDSLADLGRRAEALGDRLGGTTARIAAYTIATRAYFRALRAGADDLNDTGRTGWFGKAMAGLFGRLGGGDSGGGGGRNWFTRVFSNASGAIGPAGVGIAGVGILGLAQQAGILGILTDLLAAGMGLGSLGALGYKPATALFTQATGGGGPGALAAQQRGAVGGLYGPRGRDLLAGFDVNSQALTGIRALIHDFTQMSQAIAPLVDKIVGVGVAIAQKLMPYLLPFAQTAGQAILRLLQGFDQFAASPGFKQFMAQMLRLSGPTINALFYGLAKVAIAVGKFLEAVGGPNSVHAISVILYGLAGLIRGFTLVTEWAGHMVTGVSGALMHMVTDTQHWAGNIRHWIDAVVTWFGQIPSRFMGALKSLAGDLFHAGQQAITGLIDGLKSIPVVSTVGGIVGSIISGAKGLLGIHSPSVVMFGIGQMAGQGLAAGLASTSRLVGGAAGGLVKVILRELRAAFGSMLGTITGWNDLAGLLTGPFYTTGTAGTPGSTTFSHTGLPVTTGGTTGTATPRVSAGTILRNLGLDITRIRRFTDDIKRLERLGLSRVLISQIIQAGPDAGFQIAEAILAGGLPDIRQLNREEAELAAADRALAQAGVYGPGGGRHHARHGGVNHGRGGVGGFGGGTGGGVTVNIYGPISADQTAREIQKILLQLKRHNGGTALGLA